MEDTDRTYEDHEIQQVFAAPTGSEYLFLNFLDDDRKQALISAEPVALLALVRSREFFCNTTGLDYRRDRKETSASARMGGIQQVLPYVSTDCGYDVLGSHEAFWHAGEPEGKSDCMALFELHLNTTGWRQVDGKLWEKKAN